MSVKVMAYVWETDLKGPQKLMLLAIADHCNDDGESAFPGLERLAMKGSVTIRSAQRTIMNLEESGELHVEERAGIRTSTGQWTNRYTLIGYKAKALGEDISGYEIRARGDKNVTPSDGQGVTPTSPQEVTRTSGQGVTPASPLQAQGVTPTSPESSESNQPSESTISNQPSVSDDDDDFSPEETEILKIFSGADAAALINDYSLGRVLQACRFVIGNATIRNKTGYARKMIVSEEPMAGDVVSLPVADCEPDSLVMDDLDEDAEWATWSACMAMIRADEHVQVLEQDKNLFDIICQQLELYNEKRLTGAKYSHTEDGVMVINCRNEGARLRFEKLGAYIRDEINQIHRAEIGLRFGVGLKAPVAEMEFAEWLDRRRYGWQPEDGDVPMFRLMNGG